MSGGSYDYLCHSEPRELFGRLGTIETMASDLAELGYAQDAAKETEELLLLLRQIEMRLEVRFYRLQPIWKAMEWWRSCDWGEDDVKAALAEYRKEADG